VRIRAVRDEYLEACRRRGNAEATVVTKKRAAEQFLLPFRTSRRRYLPPSCGR